MRLNPSVEPTMLCVPDIGSFINVATNSHSALLANADTNPSISSCSAPSYRLTSRMPFRIVSDTLYPISRKRYKFIILQAQQFGLFLHWTPKLTNQNCSSYFAKGGQKAGCPYGQYTRSNRCSERIGYIVRTNAKCQYECDHKANDYDPYRISRIRFQHFRNRNLCRVVWCK